MDTETRQSAPTSAAESERGVVLLLCLLAGIHVFIYSAAFPFFNNVDEEVHLDLVVKYSHGEIPRKLGEFSPETQRVFWLYRSTFYSGSPNSPGEVLPLPRQWPVEQQTAWVNARSRQVPRTSYESSQPPLYYTVTGGLWRLGGALGWNEGQKLYSLRFLNLPLLALLVWLGWTAAKIVFPDDLFPRLAVPASIAFMPQSAFYSIQSDVFSPACFGLAFIFLLRIFQSDPPAILSGAAAGLALAAAFLTKLTSLPLIAVSLMALMIYMFHLQRIGKLSGALPAIIALVVCALPPALAWMFWCHENFGDLTGAHAKVMYLGWTPKPFGEWLQHPIFTPTGAWEFVSGFLASFWQGEMWWHCRPLCLPGMDWFYEILTLGLILIALTRIFRRPPVIAPAQQQALWFSFFLLAAAIALTVYVSIRFDFQNCYNPSRAYPFLNAGRLALGALIPFMLLFVCGLDRLLQRLSLRRKFFALIALNVVMVVGEFAVNARAFFDECNWFHL